MDEVFRSTEIKMRKALDHFHEELKQLRTGRASLAILDGVRVDYYGTPTPLNQMGNMSVADAQLIVMQPWDSSQIGAIEKAILQSSLGLNPSNDGKVIRIPIPPLTEDRRKELVRQGHDMAEHTRNSIRQARREGNEDLKQLEKDKEISQDDERRGHDEVQKLHDHYVSEVAKAMATKEKDILTV